MLKDTLWKSITKKLKESLNEVSYDNWIKPLEPLGIQDKTLMLKVPNSLAFTMLQSSYKTKIIQALQDTDPTITDVSFTLLSGTIEETFATIDQDDEDETEQPILEEPLPKEKKAAPTKPHRLINPGYTFDTFYTGEENLFALNSAQLIAQEPGRQRFNPLYLYGGIGLGKTHLIQAVANKVHQNNPAAKIVYITADDFYYGFSSSLREKSTVQFFEPLLGADILIVDEVHQFSGREKSQDELFKVFNHLHQQNKQLIFAAHQPPHQLEGFESRLISRFEWGLAVGITSPQETTRKSILKGLTQRENIELEDEVLDLIATEGPHNIRALEGIIISLLAHASFTKQDITLEIVRKKLQQHEQTVEHTSYTISEIIKVVTKYYKISSEALKGKGRTKEVAAARQMAMFLAKKFTNLGFKAIGAEFGGKNHSTVIHGVNTIQEKLSYDEELQKEVKALKKALAQRN